MVEIANKAAWTKLLKRVTRKMNGNCDAEDFLNSAYLRLNQYCLSHEVTNESAFLVRTAVNIGIDKIRRDRRMTDDVARLEIHDISPLQDDVIAARVRLERVKEGLSHLPDQSREILLMRRLEGRDYDDIAKRFGISRSKVERTIAKATKFLLEWTEGW